MERLTSIANIVKEFALHEIKPTIDFILDPGTLFKAQREGYFPMTGGYSALSIALEGAKLKLYESLLIMPMINTLYNRLF